MAFNPEEFMTKVSREAFDALKKTDLMALVTYLLIEVNMPCVNKKLKICLLIVWFQMIC